MSPQNQLTPMKFTKPEKKDLEALRKEALALVKKHSSLKNKRFRQLLLDLVDTKYVSLNGKLSFSDCWIRTLRMEAGVGKMSLREEGKRLQVLRWIKMMQSNAVTAETTTTANVARQVALLDDNRYGVKRVQYSF